MESHDEFCKCNTCLKTKLSTLIDTILIYQEEIPEELKLLADRYQWELLD